MRLHSRFTALFAILAVAAVLFLVFVSDATLRRAVEDRVSDRIARDLDHLADDVSAVPRDSAARDAFLRQAARKLECRITYVAPDGRVLEDTDQLPADVATMEHHADRPEIREAHGSSVGRSRRFSATERRNMLYIARRLPDGSVLRLAVSEGSLQQV